MPLALLFFQRTCFTIQAINDVIFIHGLSIIMNKTRKLGRHVSGNYLDRQSAYSVHSISVHKIN